MNGESDLKDPFRESREKNGFMKCPFQGKDIHMILRHEDVRKAAKDWQSFSSDSPFRVPIPSEEDVRSMRQLPIETDPPVHGEYRSIAEPFFARSKSPEVISRVGKLISHYVDWALNQSSIEVVRDFALPIQSKALTYLLNVPESEAETYIGWGVHVFRDGESKGGDLESYLNNKFNETQSQPGEDFFSALNQAKFRGRPLTREEMMGFANLTFAGGRDTIIHSISSIIAHLGEHSDSFCFLKENPKKIIHASEEFFRVYMPLTHIGRVCPKETIVNDQVIQADERISLCWSSANFDKSVFEKPEQVRLDRKPNPHVSFGFGTHLCLGAPHARLIVRTLIKCLCDKVGSFRVLNAEPHIEVEEKYSRINGFDSLDVKFQR